MLNSLSGISMGANLIKKKKFKPIIAIFIFFILFGLFVLVDSINYINTKNRLQKENIIVTATTYPYSRKSLSGEEHSARYYEWKYNGKYYSSLIPYYDGYAKKSDIGTVYYIYIDKENPNIFVRVNDEANHLLLGIFITGFFSLLFLLFLSPFKRNTQKSNTINENSEFKLVSGKFKPKIPNFSAMISMIILSTFFIGFCIPFIFGLLTFNIEFIIMPSLGIFGLGYILLISPYTQNSNNYYINIKNLNSLEGFELFYKSKKVNILYNIDSDGKFAFLDNANKLQCISYDNGIKMSNFTKYKIMNYFSAWLRNNNLLSTQVTASFEKL